MRDESDRAEWFVEQGAWEAALTLLEAHPREVKPDMQEKVRMGPGTGAVKKSEQEGTRVGCHVPPAGEDVTPVSNPCGTCATALTQQRGPTHPEPQAHLQQRGPTHPAAPPCHPPQIVQGYIADLLTRGAWEEAAALSSRLLLGNPVQWERWVYMFAQVGGEARAVG